ncbi:MAG: baseplate J/gp47 family protein [Sphingobium sp.]
MSSTFTAIDLSQIPAPDIIEPLDYEAVYAEMLAKLREFIPDFDDSLESDPAVRVLQVAAYFRLLDRQRVNDAGRAAMLAYAKGNDLDNLGALVGVARLTLTPADEENGTPAVMEDDEDFRRRITLAPEGYSVAGPRGAYIFYALSAASDVADASAISPAPTEVEVYVLSRTGTGAASPELLATVEAALSGEDVRPIGDQVTIHSASIVNYAIVASLPTFAGPDKDVVLAEAQARIDSWVAANRKLGRNINRAAICAALFPGGVENVLLTSPAADIPIDDTQAGNCTGITLTWGGVAA